MSDNSPAWSATFLNTALSPRVVLVPVALLLGPFAGGLCTLAFPREWRSDAFMLTCVLVGMVALVCLALFVKLSWLNLDPWRNVTVSAVGLNLERRGETIFIPAQDVRLLAAEGGIAIAVPPSVVFKTLVVTTRERTFRFRFGTGGNEHCHSLLKKICPFAVAVSFDNQVRLPDFSTADNPEQCRKLALAVVAKEFRRQGRRGLIFGAIFLCLTTSLFLLSIFQGEEGAPGEQAAHHKAWYFVAILAVGAVYLVGNGVNLMRRYRELREQIRGG